MSAGTPAKKNAVYTFYIGLVSQANVNILQANPTIAAGDFKVSTDASALGNPGTLPSVSPASSKAVLVTLSAAEMNGDDIVLIASDAAGAEWCDLIVHIKTSTRNTDDLAFPSVSGRGLDVSTGGEAGVDWANVGSPTTTVGLSGTTVKTATDVETDTQDLQARTPAALVGGRIDASVGAMAAGVVTAAAIADNAIDAAALAADVVTELDANDGVTSADNY